MKLGQCMQTHTFWNHHVQSDSSLHVRCLSSRFWGGCGDQCLGGQKKVIHRDPLLVSGVTTLATCCLTVDWLKYTSSWTPDILATLLFFQDGSRGSGSGKEGWLQPPVRHLGSRHYRHWAGWASAAHVWPPSDEVRQRGRTCIGPWMATTEWSGW